MSRTICCAMFALLATSGTAFPQRVRHRHVVHLRPLVQVTHFYHWCPPWLVQYYVPFAWQHPIVYSFPSPVVENTVPTPSYIFAGSASVSYPRLVFKDGTSYIVADYWRVDGQLHFITVEDGGTKFVPHNVPFDDLDLEQTKDRAEADGFRFMIRDKPIELWLEDRTQERQARRKSDAKS